MTDRPDFARPTNRLDAEPTRPDVELESRDDLGPVLLAACATVIVIQVARMVKPDRGVPLAIISLALSVVLVVCGLGWVAGAWRRARAERVAREMERAAELARLERLHSMTHVLHQQPSESAIHRQLIANANLVIDHDESDLVVFPPASAAVTRTDAQLGALGPDASSLEWNVVETGAAAHRTTVERGRPCYQVAVPVLTPDGLHAVLTLRRAFGSFTSAELDAAAALCGQVGAALERARMGSRPRLSTH